MITSTDTHNSARQLADAAAHSAEKMLENTRSYANHALDTAESTMDELQSQAQPAIKKLSRQAENIAHQGIQMAAQAKDKARESISHYSEATSRYVAEKPVQSVLIAAAVGAALALLVSSARGRSRY
jgi:ElaB/YqjD/DUF883 family membrane-anchored ribosome-binding protein